MTEDKLYLGDNLEVMPTFEADSIDSIVTDPPYFLINQNGAGFMGKKWDSLYTSKTKDIICKSKEFAAFVARFFISMQIASNTKEGYTVQRNVNIKARAIQDEKQLYANVQSAKKKLDEHHHILKANINSVHGIVLSKQEVLDLFHMLSLSDIIAFGRLNEDAPFVVPIFYITNQLKNFAPENALKCTIKTPCEKKEILLTSTEEARISGVIEGMIGRQYESNAIKEITLNANCAANIAGERKYKHIILSHTEKEGITNYLISLLYAMFVTPELNKRPNSSFKEIVNYEAIYHFHKNWATEALRVLKPGSFCFSMCTPRNDIFAPTIKAISDAGFNVSFSSIYHTFASGFPKAQNISKVVDKRAGVERTEKYKVPIAYPDSNCWSTPNKNSKGNDIGFKTQSKGKRNDMDGKGNIIKTLPATPQAKALDGAYGGFQPKPAVEIIIVAMKQLEEKTYVDQALKNGHGCTWLDDCRIPFEGKHDFLKADRYTGKGTDIFNSNGFGGGSLNNDGRFPANVLCEDDVLNDGIERKSGDGDKNSIRTDFKSGVFNIKRSYIAPSIGGDSGSFSRYFSLDAWFAERIKLLPPKAQKTFPWLIVPKASKSEKGKGNFHPTCKPIKLMSWLITLASREGDIVLDPFCGSGTTCIAAKALGRHYIGIEREKEYYELSRLRLNESQQRIDGY